MKPDHTVAARQGFLSFEQAILDAEQAAKDAAAQAKAEAKQKEESDKLSRRLAREAAYRRKHPPGHAQCGINWYPAGSGWTHCHKCGQALVYTLDPNAKPQECRPRSGLSTLNSELSTPSSTTDPNAKPQVCLGRHV
jgi:hypothetical protein